MDTKLAEMSTLTKETDLISRLRTTRQLVSTISNACLDVWNKAVQLAKKNQKEYLNRRAYSDLVLPRKGDVSLRASVFATAV